MEVSVEVDTKQLEAAMADLERSTPFAMSLALNKVAQAAVKDMRQSAKKTFILRNTWVSKGIRMNASTRSHLQAEVGTVDQFMVPQVEGGEKRGKNGGNVAIPLVGKGRGRVRKRALTMPEDWPQALAARDKDVFVGTAGRKKKAGTRKRRKNPNAINATTGGGVYAVWRRMPKHRLKMVYAFQQQVTIPQRWKMYDIVKESVDRNWQNAISAAAKYAIDHTRK